MAANERESNETRLQKENDYLASELERIETEVLARLPSEDELKYLRAKIRNDENAAWAWQRIRSHLPWIVTVSSTIGSVLYWLLTHTFSVGPRP